MTEDQIKHMVDRFLQWRLPENFNPDCGIHFDAYAAKKINPQNHKYEPARRHTVRQDAVAADEFWKTMNFSRGLTMKDYICPLCGSATCQRGFAPALEINRSPRLFAEQPPPAEIGPAIIVLAALLGSALAACGIIWIAWITVRPWL